MSVNPVDYAIINLKTNTSDHLRQETAYTGTGRLPGRPCKQIDPFLHPACQWQRCPRLRSLASMVLAKAPSARLTGLSGMTI